MDALYWMAALFVFPLVPAYIFTYGVKLIVTACKRNDGGRMMLLCGIVAIGASFVGFWFVARIIGVLLAGGK